MKKLILFFTLVPALLFSQYTENCIPDNLYQVSTASGVKIRKGPGQHNDVVAYVPTKAYVLACYELSTPATFEGKSGNWRRVRFKSKYGYLFDGFITKAKSNLILNDSAWTVAEMPDVQQIIDTAQTRTDSIVIPEKPIDSLNTIPFVAPLDIDDPSQDTLQPEAIAPLAVTTDSIIEKAVITEEEEKVIAPPADYIFAVETFNYCGEITHLDPGIRWYGIYYDDDMKVYRNTRIELEVIRSKYALGTGLEFDIKSESSITPHFMIGTKSKLDTTIEIAFNNSYFKNRPRSLFPGQSINIYSTEPIHDIYNFTLFATGNVTDVGICPVMENYQMKLTGEINDSLTVQDLTADIPYFGKCGMPSIYWFGDFNKDNYPDFILASQSKEKTTFVLFVSDIRANGKLVRKAGEWSYEKCD